MLQLFRINMTAKTSKKRAKYTQISLKIPKPLLNKLEEVEEYTNTTRSDFIRNALTEKLNRQSIEQNLDLGVDSRRIEYVLTTLTQNIEYQLSNFNTIISKLEDRFDIKLESLNNKLDIIILGIEPTDQENLQTIKSISLEDQILFMLDSPINQEDILLAFDDRTITEVQKTLEEMAKEKKINITKNIVRKAS